MKVKTGNIFGIWNKLNCGMTNGKKAIVCVTTNGFVKKDGTCVMGKGTAKLFAGAISELPKELGYLISKLGNNVYYFEKFHLVSFPVKHNWFDKQADMELIKKSCNQLMKIVNEEKFDYVFLPKPGCGCGNLEWGKVKKEIEPLLDDRVIILEPKGYF